MAMRRVYFSGKIVNQRTADMLHRVEQRLGYDLYVIQGSYNRTVSQSAGTHDGGGAVDISVRDMSRERINNVVLQMRKCGFAAWYRTPAQGPWVAHIHAIAIGDPELSSGARQQVAAYYNRRNGLASNGPDDGPRLDPIPVWPIKLPTISKTRAKNQFTTKKPRKALVTKRIQRLLNYRMGLNLLEDGVAGPITRGAYKKWEDRINSPGVDGVPGQESLSKLVAGFYRVVK